VKVKVPTLGCLGCTAVGLVLLWLVWPVLNDVFCLEPWGVRKLRFDRAAKRAAPLLAAISQYASDHGHPPRSLSDLVPHYLRDLPGTGLREYPQFEYYSFTNRQASMIWYDLGSRHHKPATGLWVYPDGDPDHAILAFTLGQSNSVVEARVDRMPEITNRMNFDVEMWRANTSRIEMVRALPDRHETKGASLQELTNLLGSPDGGRMLRDSPWELRINCSWGMLNWDVFFYWPTTNYPKHIYGGSSEMIGAWAYVHE